MSEPLETGAETGQRSSIEITRNAKGDAQIRVKVYLGDDEGEIREARRVAVEQWTLLHEELGMSWTPLRVA